MKGSIKLIALDIDGTLLDDNGNISNNTVSKIKELIDRGIYIVLATGRTHKSAQNIMNMMEINVPIISYNGAKITLPTVKDIFHSKMSVKDALKIIEYAEDHNVYLKVYINDVLYTKEYDEASINFAQNHGIEHEGIGQLSKNIREDVDMIVYIYKSIANENVAKVFNGMNITITSSTPRVYEFMANNCTKGIGLRRLSEYLCINRSEILAIGNALNDFDMLEYSGIGIAMKNSDFHLLNIWDSISKYTNNEEGVFQIIKDL